MIITLFRKTLCWQRQHWLYFLFVMYVDSFAKHIDVSQRKELPNRIKNITKLDFAHKKADSELKCTTSSCIKTAEAIRSCLDESIDPCTNFYEFACGNFNKNTNIPKGKASVDLFTIVESLVREQLRTIISEPPKFNESKPIRLAKQFYASCLNKTVIEERGIEPLVDILDELGGWPILKGDAWSNHNFDWIEMIKKIKRIGLNHNTIFTLSVDTDWKHSNRRVLVVSYLPKKKKNVQFKNINY